MTRDDRAVGQEREDGFRAGLLEAGIVLPEELYGLSEFSVESGYRQAKAILEKNSDIDIISCATDTIAAGAMEALKECKKERREKVKVTGFGDNQFLKAVSEESQQSIFTIKQAESRLRKCCWTLLKKDVRCRSG